MLKYIIIMTYSYIICFALHKNLTNNYTVHVWIVSHL